MSSLEEELGGGLTEELGWEARRIAIVSLSSVVEGTTSHFAKILELEVIDWTILALVDLLDHSDVASG